MNNLHKPPLNVAIIGLGSQTLNDHIPALIKRADVNIRSVCDIDTSAIEAFDAKYPEFTSQVTKHTNFKEISLDGVDFCIVSIPHDEYLNVVEYLVENKTPFIKEKPFARNIDEMEKILSLADIEKYCFICSQRRYSTLYTKALEIVGRVGQPYLFNVVYKLKIKSPEQGWRGDLNRSGGGCILDMGYHIIDQLLWWFGEPKKVFVSKSNLAVPEAGGYAEDTAIISFKYDNGLHGSILLSRAAGEKSEEYCLVGSKGQVVGNKRSLVLNDKEGVNLLNLEKKDDSEMIDNQLDFFINRIRNNMGFADIVAQHKKNIEFIDRCYVLANE